ncbi:hypothetical protein PM8797T_15021 [Gimesia maris DSM 8797]|nr:hypothetical protein PM8797T_15021 [Gimesia maris DSM 8797]
MNSDPIKNLIRTWSAFQTAESDSQKNTKTFRPPVQQILIKYKESRKS